MSLERACVNCERCYKLADKAIINIFANEPMPVSKLEKYKEYDSLIAELRQKLLETPMEDKDRISEIQSKIKEYVDRIDEISKVKEYIDNSLFRVDLMYGNDQVYAARNEAMKALEEVKEGGPARSIAGSALISCEECDYSSPKIVERIGEAAQH